MKQKKFFLILLLSSLFYIGCSDKEEPISMLPPEISALEKEYSILEGTELQFSPIIKNDNQAAYSWSIDGTKVASTRDFKYKSTVAGEFKIVFKVETEGGIDQKEIIVTVYAKGRIPVISNMENQYSIEVGDTLVLAPNVVSDTEIKYSWLMDEKEVSNASIYSFQTTTPGNYTIVSKFENSVGITEKTIHISVRPKNISAKTKTYALVTLESPFGEADNIEWKVIKSPSNLYRLAYSEALSPMFVAAKEGEYVFEVSNGVTKSIAKITVEPRDKQPSPYIAKVFDYLPAPGQYVNKLPEYTQGDTHEDMVRKTEKWLIGEDAFMITLGGWGGYVTFGFDHTIVNISGKRDFKIRGNAFGSALGRPGAPFGGSCEPGIIMVAYDKNKNGKPDDNEWYEIKGSSNFSAEEEPWYQIAKDNGNDVSVLRDYEMTYHKPTNETPQGGGDPDNPLNFVAIQNYIKWNDNKGNSGYKVKNVYHSQSYYPAWVTEDKITFKGIKLPENGVNEGNYVPGINEGNVYYVLYGFRYGYVDNQTNISNESAIDIDWAIDKDGKPANLPGIDFVKVYNGVNQENGWLGETSTEVERAEDLHLLGISINTIN